MSETAARRRRLWGDVAWTLGGVISAAVALSLPRWLTGLLVVLSIATLSQGYGIVLEPCAP